MRFGVTTVLKLILAIACVTAGVLFDNEAATAGPLHISLVPSVNSVAATDPLFVDIVVTRDADSPDTALAAWSMDFAFPSNVFRVRTVLFGEQLGQTDLLFGEAVAGWSVDPVQTTTSLVHMFEVSLLSSAQLEALQHDATGAWRDSFVLATVWLLTLPTAPPDFFARLAAGEFVLSDPDGNLIATDPAQVGVTVKTIAEPSALGLFAVALLCLSACRLRTIGSKRT